MEREIEGIIVAMVTPFDGRERIDKAGLRKIIGYLISNGVYGILPMGSQGEFYALTKRERTELIDIAIEEVNGRVLVMPNTGCITTKETIELTRRAQQAGVDAVSVITPFFISPSQEELYQHYGAICKSVEIPVLAYNNPGRTGGVQLSPSTVSRLARNYPNFAGIKDNSGNLSLVAEMIRTTPPGFKVIMGRDTLIFGGLMYGTAGAISATANVAPKLVTDIFKAYKAGDYDKARECQLKLAPLRSAFELGTFPVVVKEALNIMGLKAGNCRKPVLPLSEESRKKLYKILSDMDIL
ncbi:MAG: 4-hydroxy-tetrahydrodipicolinate synthase [Deltaproteobacteria bacterium]|nr:4-hydroxy-tetrahydrodipicolinate synthase [Deltaproteobacteria bacterium]